MARKRLGTRARLARVGKRRSRKVRVMARVSRPVKFKTSVNAGEGFPKKMMMAHRYCDYGNMTSTSGAIIAKTYLTNGMFLPIAAAS